MGEGRDLYAIKKDKTEFPVEIDLNPIVAVDGTLVLVSIIDITESRKVAELTRMVFESGPNAMVLVDGSGTKSLINTQRRNLDSVRTRSGLQFSLHDTR